MPAADRDLKQTEVLLLTGFLGSGKTTLLRRILSWTADLSDTVVLVNEFGDIGIDGFLLEDAGSEVVELTSGCICCTLSADLRQTLNRIWDRFHPRRLLIETSGVSDPKTLVPVFQEPSLKEKFVLEKTVTVLDADYWAAREAFGPLFFNQLEMAHLILLNKIDLIPPEKVSIFLKEIHESFPDCHVIPTLHCGIDPEALMALPQSKTFGIPPIRYFQATSTGTPGIPIPKDTPEIRETLGRSPEREPVSASGFVTFSFRESRPLKELCFKSFLEDLPWEVFRIKGCVRFPDHLQLLNLVGKKAEWSPWNGEAETRLAFIGWHIDGTEILDRLRKCLTDP